jgi:F-type H+-transporting ATPase subunit a
MSAGGEFKFADVIDHIKDAPVGGGHFLKDADPLFTFLGIKFYFSWHLVMMWIAAGLVFLVFMTLAYRMSRRKGGPPRGWFENFFESFVLFIRDEVIRPNLGPKADKFVPFFLTLFHFILFCNVLGLVPGCRTATGNIAVTMCLSGITLVTGVVSGIVIQGPVGYFVNFVPHGIPWPVLILLYPIEIMGLIIKHIALCIRLFANMIAGHIVIGSILGLIFFFKTLLVVPGSLLLAAPLAGLELFVAFLQAYIFVLLGSLFFGMSVNPEH